MAGERFVVDRRALAELRRDVRSASPVIRRELDKELRGIGQAVAFKASALSVKRTGRFAAQWRPSVTVGRGVAVVNRAPQARQQEYGGKVWLRRGRPYVTSSPGAPIARGAGNLPMRRVSLGPAAGGGVRVVNEAQYLIRRSAPGRRAAQATEAVAVQRIGEASRRAVERALS